MVNLLNRSWNVIVRKNAAPYIVTFLLSGIGMLVLTGCWRPPAWPHPKPRAVITPPSCSMPTSKSLKGAMAEARETLSKPKCRYKFEELFTALLAAGQGNPQRDNCKRFETFLAWSIDGPAVISEREARVLWMRYFDSRFSFPQPHYSICSVCDKRDEIMMQVERELADKRLGLIEICDHERKFKTAHANWVTLKIFLKAACEACRKE